MVEMSARFWLVSDRRMSHPPALGSRPLSVPPSQGHDAVKRGAGGYRAGRIGDGAISRAAIEALAAALVAIWQATIQEVLGFPGGRAVAYVARAVPNASLASRRLPTNQTTVTDSTDIWRFSNECNQKAVSHGACS
jgi:hypothetical protein